MEDGAHKFWEIEQDGARITVRFGRIGSVGQTKIKELESREHAAAEYASLIRSKTKKGYVLIGAPHAPAPEPEPEPTSPAQEAPTLPLQEGLLQLERHRSGDDREQLDLRLSAKMLQCRWVGADGAISVTTRKWAQKTQAESDWQHVVSTRMAAGFTPRDPHASSGIELYGSGRRWSVEITDTKLVIADDERSSTQFVSSAAEASKRVADLVHEQRQKGYVSPSERDMDAYPPPNWSPAKSSGAGNWLTGCGSSNGVLLVRTSTSGSASVLVRCHAETRELELLVATPWTIISVAATPKGWLALGSKGEVVACVDGEIVAERFGLLPQTPKMSRVRSIDGVSLATGMKRRVLRRENDGVWAALSRGLPESTPGEVHGFQAIDGQSLGNLYAVGWAGEIWHHDGTHWIACDSPSNRVLSDVCCTPDGDVYVVGQGGTIARGREHRFELVPTHRPTEDIWCTAWWRGSLYFSTLNAVYRLHESGAELLQSGSCYHLTVGAGRLWSIGAQTLQFLEGDDWVEVREI